eukprot:TRINITY_DN86287_c0_g1_i1.p1 TRINITY_DN86287_c0_g1~~TRINITY_DN86287_c0_g1_i1.p1  ORF type:complete len:261 (-),score=86.92 TRINITY_DN86287_c0_g1_i1:216-998(-)
MTRKRGSPKKSAAAQPDPVAALCDRHAALIPKKPLTAYFLFVKDSEQRSKAEALLKAEGKLVSASSLASQLGHLWRELPETEKSGFIARAKESATEHAEANRQWQSTPEFLEIKRCKEEQKKEQKAAAKRAALEARESQQTPKKRKGNVVDEDDVVEVSATMAPAVGPETKLVTPPRTTPKAVRRRPLTTMDINEEVLSEARRLSLEGPLVELAGCLEVLEQGIKARDAAGAQLLLDKLKDTNGALHEAKEQLSGIVVIS